MKLTSRFFWLLSVWLTVALVEALLRLNNYWQKKTVVENWFSDLWYLMAILMVALLIFEFLSVSRSKKFKVDRDISQTLPVNCFSEVVLTINNPFDRRIELEVIEHLPEFCRAKGLPTKVVLGSAETAVLNYQIKAVERGGLSIKQCEIWLTSQFGFLRRRIFVDCETFSKVYPNYRAINQYVLLATEQKTIQLGIRQRQQRGDGLEFHQLREYRTGDNLRQIDWRATSRLRKLISKDYQQERDQNIIFLLDSGRRMRTKDGELSHFDQALNATLLVSSIALRQGDAVGLKIFGAKDQFLLPRKGPAAISTMLNQVYDLHPANRASDLVGAAESINQQFKKRSLIVIVSNVRTEDQYELKTAVSLLKRHHLVMLANLKEQVLEDVSSEKVYQLDDALKYAKTQDYLQQREKLHQQLAHDGIIAVDSLPKNLMVNMVNQYFDIKRSGRL
ncbi:DUF58 domain-containing protein [Aliikangiella sp. G2MR2-5]|uniref:DUF58 domain-containing protein n=1 Tax=Aliikangiella sp. G2MR2-5 TaxID=2788943 RepID=UPI0018A9637A|nr:DUF58 domain-containing protein [Aliikangiella sp. G2MR2-5]